MFPKIRPYQDDIIKKTLETTKSTLIQLPTGGGKTIISKEIAIGLINNFNKKILFIAPKIVLMDQTLDTFKGLKPQKVHGSNNKFDKNHHILISTLQTASRRNSLNPDVIIIDEVHFGYEKKMLNKIMEYNPKARLIGLSATPYDENGYPLKGFDVILNDYDLTYMIKNRYLVPLRSFVLVKPDLSNVSIIAGDYEINQLSEAVSKNTVIMEIVTTSKSYIEKSIKTIVFAVDINHAELLKTAFQNEGFMTASLHSKSEEDDNEVIARFKKGYIKVLVSVLKLTTGFDVPETDLAIIARPTKSQNLYKQMVGRVLRTVDFEKTGIDKNFAILLDCGNVIENLGKPLDPIIPKDELEKKTQKLKCKECESENIKLRKSSSILFWECQDCGHKEDLENKNQYKCKNCNKKYSYENGEFELLNKALYLNCECGYETEISMATGDEEFREVDSGIEVDTIYEKKDNYYLPFEKAKNFVKKLKLNRELDWMKYCNNELEDFLKKPSYIPEYPELIYKNEWISWNDWLNLDNQTNILTTRPEIKRRNSSYNIEFLSFEDARDFVRKLGMQTTKDWAKYCINELEGYEQKPDNIPRSPEQVYRRKGWINYKDWLHEKQMNFTEAKSFVKQLNLTTQNEWLMFCQGKFDNLPAKPNTIPRDPALRYRSEWINWEDWLFGTTIKIHGEWREFNEAREFIRELGIKNTFDWKKYCKGELKGFDKKPDDIPAAPDDRYKNSGWINYADWLGTENVRKKMNNINVWLSYKEAKRFVHFLNLKNHEEWLSYINNEMTNLPSKPINIPKSPNFVYKNEGWINWNDWLGLKTFNQNIVNGYYSFEEARSYVHSLKLKSIDEWKYYTNGLMIELGNIPDFIPKNPKDVYKNKGWWGLYDWLGLKNSE